MAKAARTTKALQGPRQLKLMVPNYLGTYDPTSGYPALNGWSTGGAFVFYESYIDVNLDLDDLTMFPQAAILQDPGVYYRSATVPEDPVDSYQVLDIVSVKRLTPLDVYTAMVNVSVGNNAAPGMLGTVDDFNQIIMGTWRLMAKNSNLGQAATIQTTVDVKDFSSASPFAQDRLWCYRFLMPLMTDLNGSIIGSPASRFIIQVIVAQEDDLPYMMRLKNSYELQQL